MKKDKIVWTKEKEILLGQKLANVPPREVAKFVIEKVASEKAEDIKEELLDENGKV